MDEESRSQPLVRYRENSCPHCGLGLNGDNANGIHLVRLLTEICTLQKDLQRQFARQVRQVQDVSTDQFEKALAFQAQHLEKTLAFNAQQVEETYRRVQQSQTWQKLGILVAAAIIVVLVALVFIT